MNFTPEEFKKIKECGERFYKSFNEVHCPYFKEKVSFSSQGLEHLRFKSRERVRPDKDQFMRMKLIHLAPEVLKNTHTVQGILETKKFEKVRINNRTDTILQLVTYYEFIAVIKRNRVKIIIKQLENGKKFFWSIIPFWRMNKETKKRILHEGNPEED